MLLVLDIGNSFIKSAVFDGKKLIKFKAEKNLSAIIKLINQNNFEQIAVVSVVPKKLKHLKDSLKKQKVKIFEIEGNLKFNLKIEYKTPQTLGMDRLCSAEGAYYLKQTKYKSIKFNNGDFLVSIDCGTATTVNIIKYPNKFLGGLIAPGMEMMFNALNSATAQLPKVNYSQYNGFIGNSTQSAIASGVINSITGLLNQAIYSFDRTPKLVFVTGGNTKYILPYLKFKYIEEKMLVLYGIKAIYDKNNIAS